MDGGGQEPLRKRGRTRTADIWSLRIRCLLEARTWGSACPCCEAVSRRSGRTDAGAEDEARPFELHRGGLRLRQEVTSAARRMSRPFSADAIRTSSGKQSGRVFQPSISTQLPEAQDAGLHDSAISVRRRNGLPRCIQLAKRWTSGHAQGDCLRRWASKRSTA